MRLITIGLVVLGLIILGIFIANATRSGPIVNLGPTLTPTPIISSAPTPSQPLKEFTVIARNYNFNPAVISVNKGDLVRITLRSELGFHDLRIEGYDVGTKQINVGETDTFEFTPDTFGQFTIFCSVGDHRARGMIGALIVQ